MNLIPRILAILAAASSLLCCTKPEDPTPAVPDVPQNVILHGSTETSLTFQWNTVDGATSYGWLLTGESTLEGSTDKRNVTVSNLKPGTSYRFSVCAMGPGGKSAYSSEIDAATQGTPPSPDAEKVCVDAPLVLKLDSQPVLGSSGLIKICKADGKEVDRIDLADLASVNMRDDGCTLPKEQMVNDSKFNTFMDALPCSGKWRVVHYTPLRISGKSLIIKPHSGVLAFDTDYYVTVDAGVIEGHPGIAAGEWTFTTASAPPASASQLRVSADGGGDFCTIQRALDFADKGGCTISIAPGTYEEMLFLRDKNDIRLLGDSRGGVKIVYPNCESYANGSGGSVNSRPAVGSSIGKNGGRSVFLIESCDNLTIESLTIENSFGSTNGQAETVYFNSSGHLTIEDVSLLSYQDTFLTKGVVWVHNSLIAGHCDFIWGYPKACLFEDCEIRARAAGYIIQARVQSASDKGFVFLNCKLTAEDGVKNGSMYLARSAGQTDCWDNVTFVNCTMSEVIAAEGWHTKVVPNPSAPTATSGWKEYGSVDASGKAVTGHNAYGKVLTAAEAEPFSSRQAVLGY
ncbi:MAG: fibronectin type III domain-containing protein [Bacteroidales bacterium]|nr:fibronectin type III domain-containing protein [Bacteroidales bacterium]